MIFYNFFAYGKSNTRSAVFTLAMQSLEDFEYLFSIYSIETNAIIGDVDPVIELVEWQEPFGLFLMRQLLRGYLYRWCQIAVSELKSIADQIIE